MKLKKLLLPIAGLTLALGLAACSDEKTNTSTTEGKKEESSVVTYTKSTEIQNKIDNDETFAFVIGNANCGACQMYKEEALDTFSDKHGIKLPFVETLGIENDEVEYKAFVNLIEKELDGNFEATPTTYFIVDGDLKEHIVGAMPYGSLLEKYEQNVGDVNEASAEETNTNTGDKSSTDSGEEGNADGEGETEAK